MSEKDEQFPIQSQPMPSASQTRNSCITFDRTSSKTAQFTNSLAIQSRQMDKKQKMFATGEYDSESQYKSLITGNEVEMLKRRIKSLELTEESLKQKVCSLEQTIRSLEKENNSLKCRNRELESNDRMRKREALQKEIDKLKREEVILQKGHLEDVKRSEMVAQQDLVTIGSASSECFESLGDEHSNSNIARRLHKMYDRDWAKLSKLLSKTLPKSVDEIERIRLLSDLIKLIYDECVKFGEQEFSCLLGDKGKEFEVKSPIQKRIVCERENTRLKVKEEVMKTVFSTSEAKKLQSVENKETVNDKLVEFFEKVSDCCWQVAALSNPPMVLDFEVVGETFIAVDKYWTQYSTKKPVCDMFKPEGTVLLVVWPMVKLKLGNECYNKGDVVVVKIGKDSIGSLCNLDEKTNINKIQGSYELYE